MTSDVSSLKTGPMDVYTCDQFVHLSFPEMIFKFKKMAKETHLHAESAAILSAASMLEIVANMERYQTYMESKVRANMVNEREAGRQIGYDKGYEAGYEDGIEDQ